MSDFLARISHFSPKRLALLADELNDRVAQLEAAQHEPIAIVGIGCRLPGGVDSPDAYWQLLHNGMDAISEVPADRWDIEAWYDPDPHTAGKMSTRWGGFVGAVDGFDAGFFGISPREAQSMDPQQRLLLEVSWRALEDAGIAPPTLEGSRTGVFLGVSAADYYQLMRNAGGMPGFDAYTASGTAHSIASGRLSYTLGLRGPSISVDTACSSSLVAIHQAVASLRRRESDLALAGGVNLILGPDITVALSRAQMMAPDGRCKAFDSRADGFVRGEGCGMLVLQRLADAQATGRRVLAVVRGIAANQDGRSNGLTAPNGPAQEAVLREALADAGLQPQDIGYVEAHGTGTSLGDPIEVQALHAALGAGREAGQPLQVGSVKAAIGHLEAAAGVAGLIKAVLVLRHGQIPGQLHLRELNPYIPWEQLAVAVPRTLIPWPGGAAPRRAGVSSFGFSGTNVHVVLEEAPATVAGKGAAPERPLQVFTVSGRNEAALAQHTASCADLLRQSCAPWPDLAHAATAGRAHFAHRAAVVAASAEEAAQRLESLTAQPVPTAAEGLHRGITSPRPPRVAFLFTGQGSQHPGMARALYAGHPAFRTSIDRCDEVLRPLLSRPLLGVLFPAAGEASPIDDTAYAQPALFAVEYALAQLWMSWGVMPKALLGHSLGEIVAACVAGVFSLEDALKLVAARGALMSALPRDGSMAAVAADEARVRTLLARHGSALDIAALNGPASTVVSGRETELASLIAELQASGVPVTRLQVSHAFHSPLMEPMLEGFAAAIAGIRMQPPQLDVISNVTGQRAGAEMATPEYWCHHVRAAVQFAPSMRVLAQAGIEIFVEVGPHPVLLGLGAECLDDTGATGAAPRWLPTLRRGHDAWATLLASLAQLHVAGVPVDWAAFDAPWPRVHAALPGYPFQRERYWGADAGAAGVAPSGAAAPGTATLHPLLGHEIVHPLSEQRLFETQLHTSLQPWLRDHVIQGSVVLPSPVCMEIAVAAARQLWPARGGEVLVEDLTVHRALPVDGEKPLTVHSVVASEADGAFRLELLTLETDAPGAPRDKRHAVLATALLRRADARTPALPALAEVQARTLEPVDVAVYYAWLERLGLHFGPRFRGVRQMWRCEGEVLAHVQWPESLAGDAADYCFHPALLDACFHVVGAALPGAAGTLADAFLLMNVNRLRVLAPLGRAGWVHVQVAPECRIDLASRETFTAALHLLDEAGALRASFEGVSFKRARPGALRPAPRLPQRVQDMLHEVVWREAPGLLGPTTPTALAERFAPELPAIAVRHGFDRYAQFIPALDRLAAGYVRKALADLGVALAPGTHIATGDRAKLGVEERHRRLFERMLEIGAEDGWLRHDSGSYVVTHEPLPGDPEPLGEALAVAHPDAQAELQLTRRCARELAAVMRGRADPLALLFPGGSLADTERLYRDSPPAQAYNGLVARLVEQLAAAATSAPVGRPLRVLEIGAGTGSTTAYVLPRLANIAGRTAQYVFTDVSPLFLSRAKERFGAQAGFETRLLDISQPPEAQGFESAAFDIVIGANVLHATPDLAHTLTATRSLLAPGGTLVLLEGVTPQRFGDLTVGLLEGWWAYTDTSRRSYALMSRAQWLQLLGEHGFAEAVALPGEIDHPVWRQQAIFIASVPAAEPAALAGAPAAAAAGSRWLLLPDEGGLAQALAQALHARGDTVDHLPTSAQTQTDMAAALAAVLTSGPMPKGVLALAGLDLTGHDAADADAFMASQQRVLMPCLALAQALAASSTALPLWFVTRGGQPADNDAAHPAQATLWGLSHVVAVEQPQLSCRRVDLDPAADGPRNVASLLAEIDAPGIDDQIALRGPAAAPRRLVRRLQVAERHRAGPQALPLNPERSYLVTGGLHGLGLRVAGWLVDRGARHLVLMGRRGADATAQGEITALQARGAQVTVHLGDVGNETEVARLMAQLHASSAPLAGIVHAAGALADAVLTRQTWAHFETVMAAKVRGSWNLHRLAVDLDFLVLFSSGASVGGSAGQANHAAANAFEDALAWHRNATGRPTLSINWGPWAEIGAAADRRIAQAGGLNPIAPADGLAALEHLLRLDERGRFSPAQTAVLATDWAHLRPLRDAGSEPPLTRDLALPALAATPSSMVPSSNAAASAARAPAAAEATLAQRLAAALPNRRLALLREHVRALAARVLGLPRPDALSPDEPLRQLGLDSLMAVELRNLLGKAAGQTLPATVTFDYPSVSALVDHLAGTALKDYFAGGSPTATAPQFAAAKASAGPATEAGAEALDSLDANALAERLLSRLDEIGQPENS